jgi:hypothetical protein
LVEPIGAVQIRKPEREFGHPALLAEKPLAEARLADHGRERVEENLVAGIVIRDSNVPNLPSHNARY